MIIQPFNHSTAILYPVKKGIALTTTAAVVVSYLPDEAVLFALIQSLLAQVDAIIISDNGGGAKVVLACKAAGIVVEYIDLGGNQGLGRALNVGFERARQLGVGYVITFDQDSAPPKNMVAGLLDTHQALQTKGENCAAVGPILFDRREKRKTYFPFWLEKNFKILPISPDNCNQAYTETDVLITSGMLMKLDVWENGVRYNDGLFVDCTDSDWCFRARAASGKLFGCLKVELGHAQSDAPPVRLFGRTFFRYSPIRMYYYFRNTIFLLRMPYMSWAWKKRMAIGLTIRLVAYFVITKKKIHALRMMMRGINDGLRGVAGQLHDRRA